MIRSYVVTFAFVNFRIASGILQAAGVGTLSVSPYVGDLKSGIDTLRIVAEAYEEAGVA